MQLRGPASIGIVFAVVLAACGGGGSATQAPGGGGGGVSGGGGTGSVKYQISGSVQQSGEEPFFAFGSRFGGAAGVALNFTKEGGAIVTISETNGVKALSIIDEQHALSWSNCATFDLNISGESASGRFDCSDGVGTSVSDGAVITGAKVTGTFDAKS